MLDATCRDLELLSCADEAELCPSIGGEGIRSLYTMLRFYAENFVKSCQNIQHMYDNLQWMADKDECGDDDYLLLRSMATGLLPKLLDISMPVSMDISFRILDACKNNYQPKNILILLDQLSSTIQSELKASLFIQIPKERSRYYDVGQILSMKMFVRNFL
jgi:hypothetical protein